MMGGDGLRTTPKEKENLREKNATIRPMILQRERTLIGTITLSEENAPLRSFLKKEKGNSYGLGVGRKKT